MPVKLEDSLLRFRSIPCQMLMNSRVLLFRQNLPPRSLLTQQALPWSVSSAPPLGAPQCAGGRLTNMVEASWLLAILVRSISARTCVAFNARQPSM